MQIIQKHNLYSKLVYPCVCAGLYSGPYHSANNSERGHKLTKLLYEFTTNKNPEHIGEQLATATDVWLAGMLVADLEAQHQFSRRGVSKQSLQRSESHLRMPRNVICMELHVNPATLVVERAEVPEHGDQADKLTWLYWSLVQFAGNLFPKLDASLPQCPACKELHDSSCCPHNEKNLLLLPSKKPEFLLRLGLGIRLATYLQHDAGSFSNIKCMPWCAANLACSVAVTHEFCVSLFVSTPARIWEYVQR